MKSAPFRLAALFLCYTAVMVLAKVLFLCFYAQPGWSIADRFAVLYHGLSMDMTIAGYLSVLPGLVLAASLRWATAARKILKGYLAVAGVLLAIIITLDLVLYGYWGFRLDATPLFYFASSPEAAMASGRWWEFALGAVAIVLIAWGIYALTARVALPDGTVGADSTRKRLAAVSTLLLTGLLFIPIRGGFTVATMNVSRAYFSTDQRLNHAAIDPAFSLFYSLTHLNNFGSQYRFMSDEEAARAIAAFEESLPRTASDSVTVSGRPDIYLVILESFSAHLMPSLGGDSIAMRLDTLASEGLLFSNFYASSFRTDRGVPAILNAFHAQPSTSLTRYVDKLDRLPSLAAELKAAGYDASYYYGGDATFCNINALLANAGFDPIITETDFAASQRSGKWGVNDGDLTRRVLADVAAIDTAAPPQFIVVQHSSSHEPFEVPYRNARFEAGSPQNAFSYSDSCLMALVRGVESAPRGSRSLFVIVPDHLGAWPLGLDSAAARHHVPLVICGPALKSSPAVINTPGGQTDVAPTVLGLLGLDGSVFGMGHDLLDPEAPHYTFFSEPSMAAIVSDAGTTAIDCDANMITEGSEGTQTEATRATLQMLYKTISEL